jgi:hypothetical protein
LIGEKFLLAMNRTEMKILLPEPDMERRRGGIQRYPADRINNLIPRTHGAWQAFADQDDGIESPAARWLIGSHGQASSASIP